jgi:hypothetical protein
MIGLKVKLLTIHGVLLLLSSCGWQSAAPTISKENAEDVKLVLYLSSGDSDWKSVGENILIDTGELLHVQRNKVRPDPQYMTDDGNTVFQNAVRNALHVGKVPLKLDRKNGVVCNAARCATLYSICPNWADTERTEKKCTSFDRG